MLAIGQVRWQPRTQAITSSACDPPQRAKRETEARPLDPEVLNNLRDFAKLSTFKRTALEAIAFSMSAHSIRHLREQFGKLDKDQSGFVSLPEFLEAVVSSGMSRVRDRALWQLPAAPRWHCSHTRRPLCPSQDEALRVFEGIDQDRTNTISYTEFLAASLSRRLWLGRERIRDAFQRMDVEGKGYITQEDLKQLLGDDWSPEKVATMFREADTKGDGRIGAASPSNYRSLTDMSSPATGSHSHRRNRGARPPRRFRGVPGGDDQREQGCAEGRAA